MAPRSYLFVPADRPDRFEKALASGAHAVIIDLEDAVRPEDKDRAREIVREWLSADQPVHIRVNGPKTPWFGADLEILGLPGTGGVLLPKAEHAEEVAEIAARIAPGVPILPIIESALGLWHIHELASAPGVQRVVFGALDFQLDTGIRGDQEELHYARSQLVIVSRVAGALPPVDGVTTALDDHSALAADLDRARRFGFGAKLCIHPKQVVTVNTAFAPAASEIAWAQSVLAAIESAGTGAVRLGGEMVDRPIIERAHAILRESGEE